MLWIFTVQYPCTVVENLCGMETTNYELMKRNSIQQRQDDALQSLWESLNMTIMGGVQIDDRDAILYMVCLAKERLHLEINQNDGHISLKHRSESRITSVFTPMNAGQYILYDLLPFVRQDLSEIGRKSFSDIVSILDHIESTALKGSYGLVFDFLLHKLTISISRFGSEFIYPSELSILVSVIAGIKKESRVYNPFCGLGSFGVYLEGMSQYLGQDISAETCNLAKLRMVAHNKAEVTTIIQGDSIHNWLPQRHEFDLIISAPPFGIKVDESFKGTSYENLLFEEYLIMKGIESLKSNGKIIAIVSAGFLFKSPGHHDVKSMLIENDLLEMVIQLPPGILNNTSISSAILVVNKSKAERGSVQIVDASDCFVKVSAREKKLDLVKVTSILQESTFSSNYRIVPNEEIADVNYNLSASRYLLSVDVSGRLIGELVNHTKGKGASSTTSGKVIRISNLSQDRIIYQLDLSRIVEEELVKPYKEIKESCFLCALKGNTLKPTYFDFKGESIYVSSDIICFTLKSDSIDKAYLINELLSPEIERQSAAFRIRSAIPVLRESDFLKMRIQIPSLAEQKAKMKGVFETAISDRKREIDLLREKTGLEDKIIEQSSYLRHQLAGPVSNFKHLVEMINLIISEKIVLELPDALEMKISDKHKFKLKDYLISLQQDAELIYNVVSRNLQVDQELQILELQPFNIIAFLQKYVAKMKDQDNFNYSISLSIDEEYMWSHANPLIGGETGISYPLIMANYEWLNTLFSNLIMNAQKHAFPDSSNNKVRISVSWDRPEGIVRIFVSNTGKPFPLDFTLADYIRRGSRSGLGAGDGIGGWMIYEIVRKMSGKLEIIDEKKDDRNSSGDFSTTILIEIPVVDDEFEEIKLISNS